MKRLNFTNTQVASSETAREINRSVVLNLIEDVSLSRCGIHTVVADTNNVTPGENSLERSVRGHEVMCASSIGEANGLLVRRPFFAALVLLATLSIAGVSLHAQVLYGSLTGNVTDSSA